jgi:hypothetical protein
MSDYTDKENEKEEDIFYLLKIFTVIEVKAADYPDENELLNPIKDAIRKKVFCSREKYRLIEMGSKLFESTLLDSEEKDDD